MEDILTQKYNYAAITPFKDYSLLSDKKEHTLNTPTFDSDSVWDVEDLLSKLNGSRPESVEGILTQLPPKKKKKVFHSSSSDPIQEKFKINYLYTNPNSKVFLSDHVFYTTLDRHIKRHYGRQFSTIETHTIERSVRKRGDVVTIKIYNMVKRRNFNCIYFKKSFQISSISINLKTGNFTTGSIVKNGKSTNKSFRVNNFMALKRVLETRLLTFIDNDKSNPLTSEINEVFNNFDFNNQVCKSLGISVDDNLKNYNEHFLNEMYKFFINTKKIKVPNGDHKLWLDGFYPTEKFLKKNDRKLIASILDYMGIKSKYTIKLMHQYPQISIDVLYKFCKLLGTDYQKYLSNVNENVFKNLRPPAMYLNTKQSILHTKVNYYLTNREKENLIRVLNDRSNSNQIVNDEFVQLLMDHFNMIETIREYDPLCQMLSKTQEEFNNEHRELSKIITAMKKGWVIEYVFEKKTVDTLEEPIDICVDVSEIDPTVGEIRDTFYPYILKRDEDYIEEGTFMHHCVATYSDKDKSIIISVRTKDKKDRVTCEYDCQTGRLLQARHFCNNKPPADIEVAIEQLSEKVKKCARLGTLHNTEKKKVPIMINGVEVKKKEPTSFLDILLEERVHF
jgi:hypothetical protein